MFNQKKLKAVHNSKAILAALISVIVLCIAAISAIAFLFEKPLTAKAEELTVENVDNGKVSLGELCERHDILNVIVPDSYLDGDEISSAIDPSLKKLQDDKKITVYTQSYALDISYYDQDEQEITTPEEGVEYPRVVLKGYKSIFSDTLNKMAVKEFKQKMLLIVPKEVTEITSKEGVLGISDNGDKMGGVAFEDGSRVSEIPEKAFAGSELRFCILSESVKKIGYRALASTYLEDIVMPAVEEIGKEAFYNGADTGAALSLYHVSLPSTLKTIGEDAFMHAASLCDIENNSNDIDAVEHFPFAMNIYGTSVKNPTSDGKSYLRVVENFRDFYFQEDEEIKTREVNSSFVFSYNNLRDDYLATFFSSKNENGTWNVDEEKSQKYAKKWYFVALDGMEDADLSFMGGRYELRLPESINLTATRERIKWDWLDSSGNKMINEFGGDTTVNEYDISARAMGFRLMTRIFIPDGVTVVGDNAFFGIQIRIIDIPSTVTHIGENAFAFSHRNSSDSYIYIRHDDVKKLNVSRWAFAVESPGPAWNELRWVLFPGDWGPRKSEIVTRKFIFNDYDAYNSDRDNLESKFNSAEDTGSTSGSAVFEGVTFTYIVPVNAVAVDEDGVQTVQATDEYRLYGRAYDYTQNSDATWSKKSSAAYPTLDGYTKTVWYQNAADIADPDESKMATVESLTTALSKQDVAEVNLYAKDMPAPDFETKTYYYDDILELESKELTFTQALQFTQDDYRDYDAEFANFINSKNVSSTQAVVKNAGVYTIKVFLNPQWGVWDDSHNHTFTVKVECAEIDLGDPNNLPEFVTSAGSLGGTALGTEIYEYSDGYYLYAKTGEGSSIAKITVTNSYARYNGTPITIAAASGFDLYTVTAESKFTATESGRITAGFKFEVDDPNYVFGSKTLEQNSAELTKRGISYNTGTHRVTNVSVTKVWYIVKQQNWLIDANSTAENPESESYTLLTLNGEPVTSLVYESEFGTDADKYEVHIPKIAKGTTASGIVFTITYGSGNAPITVSSGSNRQLQEKPVSELPKYINAAMPAGSYTVKITAGEAVEVTEEGTNTFPEITETIRLSVLPKDMECSSVLDILTEIDGESYTAKSFEHKYDQGKLYLFDDATSTGLTSALNAINSDYINAVRKSLTSANDNVWADSFYNGYYNSLVIKYNLDRMQTSEYYTLANLNAWTNYNQVPRNVGQYNVYYSLSALNYNTVGGAGADDRRNYTFNTTIYRELSVSDIAGISDMVYTGSERKPYVSPSQYYTYSFNGDDYINAGAATVTFTVNDPVLNRWAIQNLPDNVVLEKDGEGNYTGVATVTYTINPATNSWSVSPQMPPWTYKGFRNDVNFITSSLMFADANVYYRIGTRNEKGEYSWKSVNGTLPIGAEYFAIDANGRIVDDEAGNVSKMLNGLSVGTYYLSGYIDEIQNVKAYAMPAPYVSVFVMQASNSWENTPVMTGWQYKGFSKDNFHAGKALYCNTDSSVTYKLYKGSSASGTVLAEFESIDEDGIFDTFNNLNVGTYTLVASLQATGDYTGLTQPMTFDVAKAANAWKDAPLISGWVYGSFAGSLFTDGETNFGATVYTVQKVDSEGNVIGNVDDTRKQLSEDELKVMLNTLGYGRYNLFAEAISTDNYDAATQNIRFSVSKADNAWDGDPPSIEGWVYGEYDAEANAPTSAQAVHTEDIEYTYQYFPAAYVNGVWIEAGAEIDKANLGDAYAGNYIMKVTADGNDNYNALVHSLHFVIEKQSNDWDTEPADRLDWDLCNTDDLDDSDLVNASAIEDSEGITYTIVNTKTNATQTIEVKGDRTALIAALKALSVGEYRITVTVKETDNYGSLQKITTSTVSLAENSWKTELAGATWAWSDFASVTLAAPEAAYGNDTIVFTVREGNSVLYTISEADKGEYETAFDGLKAYLADLDAGTYSVTASIAVSDVYTALQSTAQVFTVNKVTTEWNTATDDANGETYNWILYDANNTALTEPQIGTPSSQIGDWDTTISYTLKNSNGDILYNGNAWDGTNSLQSRLGTRKAGEYTVTAHINGDDNHTALDYSVTVIISVAENEWNDDHPGNGTSTAVEITRKYGDDISDIKFEPLHGSVVITVNGKTVTDLGEYIKNNGVNEYLIVATVAADDEYGDLIDTVRLIITKADNAWTKNLDISGWTWDDNESNIDTNFAFPVSKHGASASAVVTVKNTGEVAFEATVNYGSDRKVNENDIAALIRKLCALDVVEGGYTITVIVSETDSYVVLNGEKAQAKDFVIAKAENSWATNGEPTVGAWDFGGNTAYPSATPVFGKNTVVFTYATPSDDDEFDHSGKRVKPAATAVWKDTHSLEAGSYWLKAYVPGTGNYDELVGYYLFNINEGENAWVNRPGVVEWTWDGYDASTNLFSGSARSNQPAKFSITLDDGSTNQDGTKKGKDLVVTDFKATGGTSITASTIAKLKSFTLNLNEANILVVSDEVAKLLNALKPGKYVLTVSVDGGESLKSLKDSTTFTVRKAENSWATDETGKSLAPSVRYYSYGESDVFTSGAAVYGTTVSYQIVRITGTAWSSAVMTDDDIDTLIATLSTLGVGTYDLRAWVVAADSDPFKGLYSASDPYKTSFVVSLATNEWATNGAPKTSVSEYYAVIQEDEFDFEQWLGVPSAKHGTVVYTIMTVGLTPLHATPYEFDDYVAAIKDLKAGEYIVRVTASADNYLALTQDMSLTINRYSSKFTDIPEKLTGKWQQDANKKTDTVLDDAVIKAYSYITVGDTDETIAELNIQYILRGVTYNSFADLKAAVKSLSNDSYQVAVEVKQTDVYDGLSTTLQLDIAAGDNSWVTGGDTPAPENSIIVKGDDDKEPVTEWVWSTEVDWLGVKPLYGDTVVIRIVSESDPNNVLKYFTVNMGGGFDTQRELVSTYISKLDVGSYIMIITAPSGDNWSGIDDAVLAAAEGDESAANTTRLKFKIVEAQNDWKSEDLSPQFVGNNITYTDGMYKWVYGTSVTPKAEARYGTVSIVYYDAANKESTSMPTDAGTYTAVFSVAKPSTGNYTAIDGAKAVTLNFTIEGYVYEAFVVSPGVSGWVWNNYNRTTNLIKGKPVSGGVVHFEVLDEDGLVLVEQFKLVDENGKSNDNFDTDIYVSTAVAAKLNALLEGTYTLRLYVDAKANYEAFDYDTTFKVTEAINTWEKSPKIESWYRGSWSTDYAPEAVSRYGTPVIVITSNVSGEEIYRAVYNRTTGEYDESLNLLESADAGRYTMSVSVDGSEGMYSSIDTTNVPFQIFIQGSPDDKNFWEVTPGIEGWTANTDGNVVMPTGTPVRGKPYFVFYRAELEGDEYKIVEKVVAGADAVTIPKGVKYAQEFYIPMAPGTYFMYSYAVNAAVPEDALGDEDSSRVTLTIRNRTNAWEKSVTIPSLMYLGNRNNWSDPVAKAMLPNSEITYKYINASTHENMGSEIPTKVGKYVVVASASARYSQTIESEMEFEVMLSKNYWVGDTSPTIENWSEEFSNRSPDPVGRAAFGTIVYTYINKADRSQVLTEKPTVAGNYIMIARVDLDGYETLEAHYEFTVEPAYDSTLALIDIILGIVACILAVVVIIFAVKRYKEN